MWMSSFLFPLRPRPKITLCFVQSSRHHLQEESAISTSTLLTADNNSPTSGSNWVISELAPWMANMSDVAMKKIALATGMPEYTMYLLQCMMIQMLDCTSVTEGAKRLSVGHLIASSQIVKSYLSQCNVIDIQGLVQRGKESKNCIMLHGLHHVKAITDTPSSLHAVGIAAQGLPAHEYQALKVDHDKKMKCLTGTQSQLQCQTMIEHTYKEKEDLNHDPAHTSSPASGTSLSAEEPMSLLLCEKLNRLCNQIGSMIRDLPQPEYDLLKKDEAGVPLCELFAAMMTNNVSTQNAVLATLEKQNGKSCCWCHQPFRLLLSSPSKDSLKLVTWGMMINHMWSCARPHMYSKYKEACYSLQSCPHCFKEPNDLVGHVHTVHIYPDHSPVHHCPFCNKQIPTYDFTDHLKASRAHECRENWISWVQSITPSPPPPAAMLSIQSVAQEKINASMAQAVTDAKEQVAGQVGHSVLPISSTGATQEASSANSSCPMLSACCHGHCGRPLVGYTCSTCPQAQ
ncbi:hypothetical protein NDA10_003037 [Ustilago hordei]|nr:hypothetical protein NDA10_003037 [Ustilago hordei]